MRPRLLTRMFVHGALIAACLVTVFPVLWVLQMAFTDQGIGGALAWEPGSWSLGNFRTLFGLTDGEGHLLFWRQLGNSLLVSLLSAILGVFFACTAAYAFSRFDFVGKKTGLRMFLVSQMFPGVVMAVPLYLILQGLGLVDNPLGLVLVYGTSAVPFSAWMLKGYFDRIPPELEEVARLEGAGPWLVFRRIALPIAMPGVAVTFLFSFMTAWNEYILAATFLNSELSYTLPVTLQSFVGAHSTEWGLFAAGSLIVSIPVVLLFFLLQRNLVQGLTAGSTKG